MRLGLANVYVGAGNKPVKGRRTPTGPASGGAGEYDGLSGVRADMLDAKCDGLEVRAG